MDITQTNFKISGILDRMPRSGKPKRHEAYMFAKGLYHVFNAKQIEDFESVIEEDYQKVKQFIKEAKSQSKK